MPENLTYIDVTSLRDGYAKDVYFVGGFDLPASLCVSESGTGFSAEFSGRLTLEGRVFTLEGSVAAAFTAACARCLKPFPAELIFELRELFSLKARADDGDVSPVLNGRIDLAEAVYMTMLSQIPQKLLCRETCLGLCQGCGVNKNDGNCICCETEEE